MVPGNWRTIYKTFAQETQSTESCVYGNHGCFLRYDMGVVKFVDMKVGLNLISQKLAGWYMLTNLISREKLSFVFLVAICPSVLSWFFEAWKWRVILGTSRKYSEEALTLLQILFSLQSLFFFLGVIWNELNGCLSLEKI